MTDPEPPLLDFTTVPGRVRAVAAPLAGVALLACIVDGALNGLTFALMGRWLGVYVIVAVFASAAVVAAHALGGADAAARRGQRLSSDDVGLTPRRRLQAVPSDDADADDAGSSEQP